MTSNVTSEQETEGNASLQLKFEALRNTLQVIVQSEFGLLSKLRSSKVLTLSDQQTIKAGNTTIDRNQRLLETIFERGKYHEFIDALRNSGQTHVVNWINADGVYRPEFGLDWPLTEREIEILDSNYDQLGEILNVKEELIRILFSKLVINERQKDFISSKLSSCEANEAFLDILRQSSLKTYFLTVQYLRKLKEVRSANILDNVAIAVPVHVNLGGENADEMETQLIKKVTLLCLEDTSSCDTADLDNFLARLRVSIISAKKGLSIVLFVSCCTADEFRQLCTIVDNNDIKTVLEKLFKQLLQNFLSKVVLVRVTEADREKAEKLFQRELLRDKEYDDHFQQLWSQLKCDEPMEVTTEVEEFKEEEFPEESEVPSAYASVKEFPTQIESCIIVAGFDNNEAIGQDVVKIRLNGTKNVYNVESLPPQMRRESAAAVYSNTLFVTGLGRNCGEIWKFDARSSNWEYCNTMIRGRRRHSVAFVDHFLYICGGWVVDGNITLDGVEAYNTIGHMCTTVGNLFHAVRSSGNCVPFKSSLYIFGGMDAKDKNVDYVQVYDTKLNYCSLLSKRMPLAYCLLRSVLWENKAILLGYRICFIYSFKTGTWQMRDQFKTDVVDFGVIANKGRLFVIGGGENIVDDDGNESWIFRDDVRSVPVANVLKNKSIEWLHHAKLPKHTAVYCSGKIEFLIQ